MDASRVDGVKAPQHRGTPRSCFPSNHSHFPHVIKNCDPFVSRPLFAMDSSPGPECLRLKFSSANDSP